MALACTFHAPFETATDCQGRARHSVRAAVSRRARSDAPYHKREVFGLGTGGTTGGRELGL